MARDSFVCNASIFDLCCGTEGVCGYDLFVCNASIVGLWLGTGCGLWLEIHLFVMLVKLVFGCVQEVVCG